MSHQQHVAAVTDGKTEHEPSSAFLSYCYRSALQRLDEAFAEGRSLAVLVAEGKTAPNFVINSFLSKLDDLGDEVVIVRFTEPCSDAVEFMSEIIRTVGFDPEGMRLEDLESVFRMFLSFQKGHDRRTVVCIEQTQDCDWWVLDKIRSLVEMERKGRFGLMTLIAGAPALKGMLYSRPLNAVKVEAVHRIMLVPFSLKETQEFIRRHVEGSGRGSVEQTINYHSIALIHELSRGVPDAIGTLVDQCLAVSDEKGGVLVKTDLVKQAYEKLRGNSPHAEFDGAATTFNVDGVQKRTGRLIVKLSDEDVRELALCQGHVLIGRSRLCDIRIDSPGVSRQHALIVYCPTGITIVDLSSTNGTFVDGYPITAHELAAGETISIGNCTIEYIVEDIDSADLLKAAKSERNGTVTKKLLSEAAAAS